MVKYQETHDERPESIEDGSVYQAGAYSKWLFISLLQLPCGSEAGVLYNRFPHDMDTRKDTSDGDENGCLTNSICLDTKHVEVISSLNILCIYRGLRLCMMCFIYVEV